MFSSWTKNVSNNGNVAATLCKLKSHKLKVRFGNQNNQIQPLKIMLKCLAANFVQSAPTNLWKLVFSNWDQTNNLNATPRQFIDRK